MLYNGKKREIPKRYLTKEEVRTATFRYQNQKA